MRILICSMIIGLFLVGCESNNSIDVKKINSKEIIQAIQENNFTEEEIKTIVEASFMYAEKSFKKNNKKRDHYSTDQLKYKNDEPCKPY